MADTIVHVPPETHARFKSECKRRNLRMRDVVELLINDWLAPGYTSPDAVKKKPAQRLDEQPPAVDPFTLPPFWAGARAPK